MNITQNDSAKSVNIIKQTEEAKIPEESFWQKRKKCIIITAISSIVVIAGVVILIVLLTKKGGDKKKKVFIPDEGQNNVTETEYLDSTDTKNSIDLIDSTHITNSNDLKNSDEGSENGEKIIGNFEYNKNNYIKTTMIDNFKISSNEKLQIVGADYQHKNDTLIFSKNGKVFNINKNGQIEGVSNDDLPLYYSFNKSIINGSYLFKDVKCFKTIDLSNLDSSKMVDASGMFENSDFEEIYFGNENSSNETNTRYLQETSDLSDEQNTAENRKGYFETSEIKSASNMFLNCLRLKKIQLPPFFNVGKNAKGLFKGCIKLVGVNTSFIISNEIEEMESMFEDCTSLKEISFSNDFLTGEVKSLNNAFKNTSLSLLDISYLRLFNLQSASNIFTGTTIKGTLKLGKYFSNDTLRDKLFLEIAKVTDSKTNVYTPNGTTINIVFETIYYNEKHTRINTTIIDIDFNIIYREEKNYRLYSNELHFGLGWDYNRSNTYDLDSSVVTFDKKLKYLDRVNFQQLEIYDGVINLNGDDLTGEGDGDDEEIRVKLDLLPSEVQFFTVQINSYRGNSLKNVKSAYIRLSASSEIIGTYSINQAGDNIGLLIGCFFKNISNNSTIWNFKPLNKVIPGHVVVESVEAIQEILQDILDVDTENDMIKKLVSNERYIDQKNTLTIIGNLLFDNEYEVSFVAGVLANIYHEADIGRFESSAYDNHPNDKPQYLEYMDNDYNYRKKYSNKLITEVSLNDLSEVLEKCKANDWKKGKFGLGCVQWTEERTYTLFQLYQQKCNYSDKITIEQATAAEGEMIINELKGNDYKYIYNEWKNNNADKNTDLSAYNAAYNICIKYEQPDDTINRGIVRGNTAKDMYKIMTS